MPDAPATRRYESTLAAEALEARRRLSSATGGADAEQQAQSQGVVGEGTIPRKLLQAADGSVASGGEWPMAAHVVEQGGEGTLVHIQTNATGINVHGLCRAAAAQGACT